MKTKFFLPLAAWLLALSLFLSACSLSSDGGETQTAPGTGETEGAVQDNESGADSSQSTESQTPRDLSGLKLSILGDSISTFDGYIPTDYNIFYPGSGDISTVEKTWWWQVMNKTGMELNANASSSNTTITGDSLDTTGSAPGCSTKRMIDLTPGDDGPAPDILIVFMGTNDFLRSVELGTFTEPSKQDEGIVNNFCDAYELMIQKLNALYPNAEIYYCTLLETNAGDVDEYPQSYPSTNKNGNTIGDFNAEIATIASAYSYQVIDVHNCGITYETLDQYTSDGVHPNAEGAKLIAEYVTNALLY
ncbi:MAG TPA: SGNH/GDSL hydrolase family protein [Candidatus Eisenbergiella merdipullorum]|uniref:SGNH/GDSL hydrolase family protein n=1 Tax=Candidatus Eisenbergiella merdipullorum TaxID=2838553 RepID=A0A9D2L1P9_9FIRM|nr:SGNH/GDSL hydrolase family protein [Candidatus Eisenbergiella merdipullorum]